MGSRHKLHTVELNGMAPFVSLQIAHFLLLFVVALCVHHSEMFLRARLDERVNLIERSLSKVSRSAVSCEIYCMPLKSRATVSGFMDRLRTAR
jgi:hypothetical protein